MKKCDASPAGSAPRRFIDQAITGSLAPRQRAVEIGNTVADVMDAGATLGKKLRHGTVGIGGFEQLDVDRTEMQADDGRAVGRFRPAGSKTQNVAVKRESVGNARDRDADMGD